MTIDLKKKFIDISEKEENIFSDNNINASSKLKSIASRKF